MSRFDNFDLIVRDVAAAVDFFERVVRLTTRFNDANFAEME